MFRRMKRFACFALVFSLLCIPAPDNYDYYTENTPITLSQLPPDITLVEALERYPQLQNIYPVRIISAEKAAERIAQGATLITDVDGDAILAVPFLSQLNAINLPPASEPEIRE